jgi:fukutin
MRSFYTHKIIKGEDGSERDFNKTENIGQIALHYIFTKNDCHIQVAVFHTRNQLFWVGKLPKDVLPNKSIYIGREEAAFDLFQLIQLIADDIVFYVPSEATHFLGQIKTSKFIECNYEIARWFSNNNKQEIVKTNKMDKKAEESIVSLKTFMKKMLMPFWISSGTLLGWYRQCGIIPYTSDADFATWSIYASESVTQQFIKNDVGLKLRYIYGIPEDGYQYAFYTKNGRFRVDLFYMYEEDGNFTYTGHIPSKKAYFRYIYPKFTLCSAELIGYKVLIPCNPEEVIRAEYGEEWRKPVKRWNYATSAYNLGPMKHWSPDVVNNTYTEN